jgi:Ca2+-binding EF-hand superfamily protein
MVKKSVVVAMGLLLVAGGAAAVAAVGDRGAGRGDPGQRLKRLDADNDQAVTIDEFLKRRGERFVKLDANSSGTLEAAEIAAGGKDRGQKGQDRLMKRLDQNADGRITKEELDQAQVRLAAKADGSAADAGGGEGKRRGRRGGFGRMSPERLTQMFAAMDSNSDGTVETAEFEAARAEQSEYQKRRAMHLNDKNRDGKVTLDEFTADDRTRFSRFDLDGDGKITAPDLPPQARGPWTKR